MNGLFGQPTYFLGRMTLWAAFGQSQQDVTINNKPYVSLIIRINGIKHSPRSLLFQAKRPHELNPQSRYRFSCNCSNPLCCNPYHTKAEELIRESEGHKIKHSRPEYLQKLDTNERGRYAELLVLTKLAKEGRQIAIPFGNQSNWDCLVEEDGQWIKYQVKVAQQRFEKGFKDVCGQKSGWTGSKSLNKRNKTYQAGAYDFLIAVCIETGIMWKIPASLALNKARIILYDSFLW